MLLPKGLAPPRPTWRYCPVCDVHWRSTPECWSCGQPSEAVGGVPLMSSTCELPDLAIYPSTSSQEVP